LANAHSLADPTRSLEAAHRPFLAIVQDPVLVVGRERVVAGATVDHVALPDAPKVEVLADDVVVA